VFPRNRGLTPPARRNPSFVKRVIPGFPGGGSQVGIQCARDGPGSRIQREGANRAYDLFIDPNLPTILSEYVSTEVSPHVWRAGGVSPLFLETSGSYLLSGAGGGIECQKQGAYAPRSP